MLKRKTVMYRQVSVVRTALPNCVDEKALTAD
jgi:hypothetical protein